MGWLGNEVLGFCIAWWCLLKRKWNYWWSKGQTLVGLRFTTCSAGGPLGDLALVMSLWDGPSSHALWEGGAPSEVHVWMSLTAMKHPLESALWIMEQNKKSVLHSHVFPPNLLVWVWCFHFLRWGAGELSLFSVFKNRRHWGVSPQAYKLLKSISMYVVFNV